MKPIRYDKKEIEKYVRDGYWKDTILPDYWERNAERWPDKEALVDSAGTRLTWQQAVLRINRIALALVKVLELERDDRLMIQLPNIAEQVLVRLAIEKAGILSIPDMPTFRHNELKWIGEQIHAVGVIIPKIYRNFDHYEMIKELQVDLPYLKHIIIAGEEVPEGCFSLKKMMSYPWEEEYELQELETRKLDPIHEVGFLVSTTGTTGKPKIVEHRIAAREIWTAEAHIRNWELSYTDVVVAFAPLAGAAGGTPAYVCAPVAGAKIVLGHEYEGEEICQLIEREKATVLALVPAQLSRLLQLPLEKYDLSSLRFLKTAGGYLSPPLAQEAEERFGCPILGTFGSQDTGSVSGVPLSASKEVRYTTVGRVHPGVEIKVLDQQGREVEAGDVGTLYFKGPGNSIGYYRNIEMTLAEAFDQEGWATTGDLVILTDDGWLKIMGRKKDIIIRGGQNIYPQEIEDYLAVCPQVIGAAVVAMPDPVMGERACAFVTLKKGETFTFEDMVNYLKSKKIAMFKIPERLEIIESMPLAGATKIDKKELTRLVTEKLMAEGKIKRVA
jgi:non-ribosomal peptide synthetase component E (peptide arylation enzyme)